VDSIKIGLISDSHSRRKTELPQPILAAFHGVELILHAGDICDLAYLSALGEIANVEAVAGNNENDAMEELLGFKKIIEVGNRRIGVVHGHRGKGRTTLLRAYNSFIDDRLDIIVFGHSHESYYGEHNGITMINPGSISRPRGKDRRPSVALLTINESNIKYKLIKWEK
jgi:putative phosphoesterase